MMYKFFKRLFDIIFSFFIIFFLSPIVLIFLIIVFLNDFKNPFFISKRVGINNKVFHLLKIRSMSLKSNINFTSTSKNDPRLTSIGMFIRKFKLDELPQFINVFLGSMSVVGPRPQIYEETLKYTNFERKLFNAKPGITDFSSIIFSDEGNIISNADNPDEAYDKIIRPYKSRLGIFYIEKQNLLLDLFLIFSTLRVIISRDKTLHSISNKLNQYGASKDLVDVSKRDKKIKIINLPS